MKYKAEIFDQLQYLFEETKFNDHQLHCVIRFDNKLNTNILKKAITLLLKTVPILSCVYHHNHGKSYWEKREFKAEDILTFTGSETQFNNFTTSKINEETEPQIKVCLFQSEKDSLSIILNHMVSDGAGFKQCLYLLSDLYSNLMKDPGFLPEYVINGNRSMQIITSNIGFWIKLKALLFQRGESNQKSTDEFPLSKEGDITPFILTHELSPKRTVALLAYCKQNQVTINDAVLAAYYRVLAKMLHAEGKPLHIPIMIDMRKYIKEKSWDSLSNYSSTVITTMRVNPGESYKETLSKVSQEMSKKKANYMGLNGFIKLVMVNGIMTKPKSYGVIKKFLKNPLICMTNIGILDSEKFVFEGSIIRNAFVCGSIKYRPHFQLALSTFANKITFSSNLYGSKEDYDTILLFFDLLDKELP